MDAVFHKYEAVVTKEEAQKLVINGNRIPVDMIIDFSDNHMQEVVRLYDSDHRFIGLYAYLEESKEFKPIKLFME